MTASKRLFRGMLITKINKIRNGSKIFLIADVASNSITSFAVSLVILTRYSIETLGLYTLYFSALLMSRMAVQAIVFNQQALAARQNAARPLGSSLNLFHSLTLVIGVAFTLLAAVTLSANSNFSNAWMSILILLDLHAIFFRNAGLIYNKYGYNFVASFLRVLAFFVSINVFYGKLSPIENIFLSLIIAYSISNAISWSLIGTFPRTFYLFEAREASLRQGRYQLTVALLSWGRANLITYIIALSMGIGEVGIYRLVQLIFSPLAIAFSGLESFMPQNLSRLSGKGMVESYIHNARKKTIFWGPVVAFFYVGVLMIAKNFMNLDILTAIDWPILIMFSVFTATIPINVCSIILFRYFDRTKDLQKVFFVDFVLSTALLGAIANFGSIAWLIFGKVSVAILFSFWIHLKARKLLWLI
jgi:O-antigen/teichoic acid export membrane protein